MSPVPEHIADLEHRVEPSIRITDDLSPPVFESLGRLRSLTRGVTIASLDEGIEKLLQSVQRLRSFQENLHSVAAIKHRLMNTEVRSRLETNKEPEKKSPPGNLIPFPGLTKKRDASEMPKADLFCPQGAATEKHSPFEQAPQPSNKEQPDIGRPLNSFQSTLSELSNVTKELDSLLARLGKKHEPGVLAQEHTIAAKEAVTVVSTSRGNKEADRKDKPLAAYHPAAINAAEAIANSDPPTILNASVTAEGPALRAKESGLKGRLNDVIVAAENPAAQQNVPILPALGTVDREIRDLVKTYGQVDKYAANKNNGILGKVSFAVSALLVFLAVSYFFFSTRQPGQSAAQVDHPHEFTTLAGREAVIPPEPTESDQAKNLGNFSHAIFPVAQARSSSSQDHPIKALALSKPIERDESKISGNPSSVIVPATQQPQGSQDRPDKLNP